MVSPSPSPSPSPLLGTVLVTGGCGFLGYHIIKALLQDPNCGSIVSVSRNPTVNLQDGVTYRAGNITDFDFVRSLFQEVQPRVIFHVASPRPIDYTLNTAEFRDTNIEGTVILLKCAAAFPSVTAFVYSSSVNVLAGSPHIRVDENGPMWQPNSKAIPYWRSKAAAERLVLGANSLKLRTVSLRLCLIVGEREHALIPAQLDAYDAKKTSIQLGDNSNLVDTVSAENAATAHLLAATALVDPSRASGKVDGEAFQITDGNPLPFWDLARMIWRAAGDTTQLQDVTVIPTWAAMALASAVEWLFAIFTLGTRKPEMLNTHVVDFCTREYT
ncbi:MAG: hypothetical protein Q9187_005916, partial [Circinaria calcarea]